MAVVLRATFALGRSPTGSRPPSSQEKKVAHSHPLGAPLTLPFFLSFGSCGLVFASTLIQIPPPPPSTKSLYQRIRRLFALGGAGGRPHSLPPPPPGLTFRVKALMLNIRKLNSGCENGIPHSCWNLFFRTAFYPFCGVNRCFLLI